MKKQKYLLNDLESAFLKLKKALQIAKTELKIDGVIQRFEFTFELCWKTIKLFLQEEGIESKSPKMAIKEAYSFGLIKKERIWLNMLSDRNLASHTYNKKISGEIFKNIKKFYITELENLIEKLKDYINQ